MRVVNSYHLLWEILVFGKFYKNVFGKCTAGNVLIVVENCFT
jgi:hypothetical protein